MSTIGYAAWAFAAGALIPLMAILNAVLARATGATLRPLTPMRAIGLFIVVVGVVITQLSDRMAVSAR